MKYIGTYSNDTDIATKAKVDAKQDKVLANGILQGDGAGTISAAETQEVELVELTKADVGLGNVDNTSDANKPISTATQTALNGKQDAITGGASTITSSNLTADRALVSDASGKVAASEVTSTELGYLDGVTSNIQTQLNGKQNIITANGFLKGDGSGNITSDKPVFTVNMTPTAEGSSTYTADKTVAQIVAAHEAGYTIQAVSKVPGSLVPITLSLATFVFDEAVDAPAIILFSASVFEQQNGGRGWSILHADYSENWQVQSVEIIPDSRTINTKPLSSDITLTAADVNAVGLTGDQTIAGDKTFSGGTIFDGGLIVKGGSIFTGQQDFNDGMAVGSQTFYKENSTVDFTNATVTGLPGLLPTVGLPDSGKFLRVVNGAWAAATVENANGVSF